LVRASGSGCSSTSLEAIEVARRVAKQANIARRGRGKGTKGAARIVAAGGEPGQGRILYKRLFQHIQTKAVEKGGRSGRRHDALVCGHPGALGVKDEVAVMAGVDAATRKVAAACE